MPADWDDWAETLEKERKVQVGGEDSAKRRKIV